MKKILFSFLIFTILALTLTALSFNRFILPILTEISSKYAITQINNEINRATDSVISNMGIKSSDFTEEISNTDLSHINIDSLLINRVSNKIVLQISENLNGLSTHTIKVPSGAFSGIPLYSRLGISIPLHITSMGDASADYETSLSSAGVNQVTYQVWLNIECNVSVVSPVFSKNITIKRKLMLVNTVFNGKVPNGYANISLN